MITHYKTEFMPEHQKAMLVAARCGNRDRLSELFSGIVKTGDDIVHDRTNIFREPATAADGPPATWKLIDAALAGKHESVLRLVLSIYSKGFPAEMWPWEFRQILVTATANPELACFKVLQTYDPSVVTWEEEYNRTWFSTDERQYNTTLCKALKSSDPQLAMYLLDNGADPDKGYFNFGALCMVICHRRPLDIVRKMLDSGASLKTLPIHAAAVRERLDILE